MDQTRSPASRRPIRRAAIAELASIRQSLRIHRPGIICDPALTTYPAIDAICQDAIWTHHEFQPNPSPEAIHSSATEFRRVDIDAVIAIGGGSSIDFAKALAAHVGTGERLTSLLDSGFGGQQALPIIAVPTTIGTGSEATTFAALYDRGLKRSLDDPSLLPKAVILDHLLTARLPATQAADSALDALCQSIESLWSIGATPASMRYARRAARCTLRCIESAVAGDTTARRAMLHAAHYAGRAINLSKTTAAHALAYPLTIRFGVPHGLAVATWLPVMLEFNSGLTRNNCAAPIHFETLRSNVIEATSTLAPTAKQAAARFRALVRRLGRPATLAELAINPEAALQAVAESADPHRMGNNPRLITPDDLPALVQSAHHSP